MVKCISANELNVLACDYAKPVECVYTPGTVCAVCALRDCRDIAAREFIGAHQVLVIHVRNTVTVRANSMAY